MRKALEDQHVTVTEQDEKIEQLKADLAGLKVENLNANELIHQLTTAQEAKAAAESSAQTDTADEGAEIIACRRPEGIKLSAEFEEARIRFRQSANKLNAKLDKAESNSHAESERAGELANHNQELAAENMEMKEKLRFEEDRLEAANRRVNEANERAESVEQQLQEEVDQLEEELSEAKRELQRQENSGREVDTLEAELSKMKKEVGSLGNVNRDVERENEKLKRDLKKAREEQQSAGDESDSESNAPARSQSVRKKSSKLSK